jgi:hypothetical protein
MTIRQAQLLILFIVLTLPAAVAAFTVEALVDRTSVTPQEAIRLSISVEGGDGEVDLSGVKDFKVISRGSGTSVQIINGHTTRTTTDNYLLIPLKTGSLKIPPLPVQAKGEVRHTKEIVIQVSEIPPDQPQRRDLFVEASVTTQRPYLGQQLAYTFRLLSAVRIANARLEKPTFDGFHVKEAGDSRSRTVVINGRQYNATEVTYILIPHQSRPLTIVPAVLECGVVRKAQGRRRSFFDDHFFSGTELEPRLLKTKAIQLEILPLPPFDEEGEFSGLVGSFSLRTSIDNTDLMVGDSATLSLEIEGRGNIMDLAVPQMDFPEGVKTYTDNPEEQISLDETGYHGKKTFRRAIVPVADGRHTIPGVAIWYFDPDAGAYRKMAAEAIQLTVTPAEEKISLEVYSDQPGEVSSPKKRVEFTGRDILPLKEGLDTLKSQKPLGLFAFLLLLVIPMLVFGLVRLGLGFYHQEESPARIMTRKARKCLKAAGGAAEETAFLAELHRALIAAIYARVGTTGESLTWREAEELLRDHGYNAQSAAETARLLEHVESCRYSPGGLDRSDWSALLNRIRRIVRRLIK